MRRQFYRLLSSFVIFVSLSVGSIANAQGTSSKPSSSDATSSLDIVPQTATVYVASINHELLWNSFVNSNAYKQLNESPAGKKMKRAYRRGLSAGWEQFGDNPIRHYLEGYANSIDSIPGKLVMPYLNQVFGEEVFFYIDSDWHDFTKSLDTAFRELQPMFEKMSTSEPDLSAIKEMLIAARPHFKDVRVPTVVFGAVVSEPELFTGLIDLAQTGIDAASNSIPEEFQYLLDGIESVTNESIRSLSFTIRGDKVPWDELASASDELAELLPEIKLLLADKSVAVNLAVKGKLLLLSFAADSQHLKSLGAGPLLVDHELMSPVKKARKEGKRLTGVSYASEQTMRNSMDSAATIETLMGFATNGIRTLESDVFPADLREKLIAEMQSDVKQLTVDMNKILPKAGALIGYSFVSEEGIEGYQINHSENITLDASKPLTLTQHVGPSPALLAINRDKSSVQQYELVRKWGGRLMEYVQKYVPDMMEDEEDATHAMMVIDQVFPILKKLDAVTAEKLVPNTQNGQLAMVLDFSIAKTSWAAAMPPAETPLPFPGFSIVMEISDADAIKQAGEAYLSAAREFLAFAKEMSGGEIPDEVQIPDPVSKKLGDAEMFYYAIPPEAGIDSSVAPHAVISNKLLVLGFSEEQSKNIFKANSPKLFGPAGETGNAMSLTFMDNRQVINALDAWTQYGLEQAKREAGSIELKTGSETTALDMTEDEIHATIASGMNFAKCFVGFSSRSYEKDGAQITHYLLKFQDVPGSSSEK